MDNVSAVAKFVLLFAAFVVVIAGMKMAEALLVPFLLSVFIALICFPMLTWFKSKRVPSSVAILLIVLLVVLVGMLIGAVVGASIRDFREALPAYQTRLLGMSVVVQQWLVEHGLAFDGDQWRESFNPSAVMQLAGNTLASFGNVMTNAFLILLTVIFILAEETGFRDKLRSARGASESLAGLETFIQGVNRYLSIKTLLSLATGVLVVVWLWILGIDYAVMWGLLAFLLNFVPTIGSILAAVPAVLLALIQLNPWSAGLVAIGYVVINVVFENILEPRLMGRGLNLSPLVVFLSLVFWGWVLGPVGMLLSIPLTILVKIALENDPQTRWLGIMLGAGQEATVAVGDAGIQEPEPYSAPYKEHDKKLNEAQANESDL